MKTTPIRLLAVDDQTVTTSLVRASFRQLGVQVILVSTAEQAFAALHSQAISVIMINLDFGGVDAAELCRRIQSHKVWASIPVLVSSVQEKSPAKEAAMAAGASLFIQQPLPRSYLIAHLKDLLAMASRVEERVATKNSGEVKVQQGKLSYNLPIADISASGLLVMTEVKLCVGEECELKFILPHSNKPLHATGLVVRELAKAENGFGIRFQSFHGDSQKRLLKYLASFEEKKQNQLLYYL